MREDGATMRRGTAAAFGWRGFLNAFVSERAGGVPAQAPKSETRDSERRKMEAALERLHDLLWEAREREARYRDLLDAQGDIILRRDAQGRVTFANDAFCRTFGIRRVHALGRPFAPVVLERARETALRRGRLRAELRIDTALGARWFAWEELPVRDGSGADAETQIVARDITQERETARVLAVAKEAAEAANSAKSRFLAAMSHEIRTPMNGVIGMSGLLLDTTLTPEQTTYAQAIESSARSLLSLIDEVLDFSRIEAGRVELENTPFDLCGLVEGVVELLAPRARAKGLDIAWLVAPELPDQFVGDALRLRQVLTNLVGNAIKFTAAGGVAVRVSGNADGSVARLRLSVTDTGPGVAEEARERIFAEFEQGESGPSRPHGGTGLGLAISRRIAEAMGGTLRLEQVEGQGACFAFELVLPVAEGAPTVGAEWSEGSGRRILIAMRACVEAAVLEELLSAAGWSVATCEPADVASMLAAAPADALLADLEAAATIPAVDVEQALLVLDPAERQAINTWRAGGFSGFLVRPVRPRSLFARLATGATDDHRAAATAETQPHACARPGRRVLLAEDNDINALLAEHALRRDGHFVVRAAAGAEAVARAEEAIQAGTGFDILLLDMHMPDMDGMEAARRVRALYAPEAEAGKHRPAMIALTANAFPDDRARYLASGLDDYLAKPFEREDLAALIERWTLRLETGAPSR